MKRCGNPKNQDSHSAWKSLAKGARLSHISNTGPTVIITTRNYASSAEFVGSPKACAHISK